MPSLLNLSVGSVTLIVSDSERRLRALLILERRLRALSMALLTVSGRSVPSLSVTFLSSAILSSAILFSPPGTERSAPGPVSGVCGGAGAARRRFAAGHLEQMHRVQCGIGCCHDFLSFMYGWRSDG